jgi:3alpha(or 20beta)-hydroxysteroid dehydrogenase
MAGGHDPRRPVDRRPEVVAVALVDLPSMQAHADTHTAPSGHLSAASAAWVSPAAAEASCARANAAPKPSPPVAKTYPLCASIAPASACHGEQERCASGGARGQGESEARLFVKEGAKVVFGDVLDDLGDAVAKDIGDDADYVHHDVRREEDWDRAVAEAVSRFGSLDVLVNNAGIVTMGVLTHDTTMEDYIRVIEVNQIGVFLGMQAAIPAMLRDRHGSIINISSTAGITGIAGSIAYNASKFPVRGMTKTAAVEYGKAGIRVNSIHPGMIATPMVQSLLDQMSAEFYAAYAIPRAAQPKEVANLTLFQASDESSFCTGAEYLVDGGWLAGVVNPTAQA